MSFEGCPYPYRYMNRGPSALDDGERMPPSAKSLD